MVNFMCILPQFLNVIIFYDTFDDIRQFPTKKHEQPNHTGLLCLNTEVKQDRFIKSPLILPDSLQIKVYPFNKCPLPRVSYKSQPETTSWITETIKLPTQPFSRTCCTYSLPGTVLGAGERAVNTNANKHLSSRGFHDSAD